MSPWSLQIYKQIQDGSAKYLIYKTLKDILVFFKMDQTMTTILKSNSLRKSSKENSNVWKKQWEIPNLFSADR